MTNSRYAYTLCGWRTLSDIQLTGIPLSVESDEEAAIRICLRTGTPEGIRLDETFIEHADRTSVMNIENFAAFEITSGSEINIWPKAGVATKDLEIFVLGLAWAALCYQRGTLPLHASGIATNDGIVAFVGNSGAGKSTIAAQMNALGYDLVTDDILAVSLGDNVEPGAWPYLRRFKLKGDSIDRLALRPTERVSENLDGEKSIVLPGSVAPDRWRRLDRIYVLSPEDQQVPLATEQILGAEAIAALIDHTYHFQFVQDAHRFADHLAMCGKLAASVPIYRLAGSRGRDPVLVERALMADSRPMPANADGRRPSRGTPDGDAGEIASTS